MIFAERRQLTGRTQTIHCLATGFIFLSPKFVLYPADVRDEATKRSESTLMVVNIYSGAKTRFDVMSTDLFFLFPHHGPSLCHYDRVPDPCGPIGKGYFSVDYKDPIIAVEIREISLGTRFIWTRVSHILRYIEIEPANRLLHLIPSQTQYSPWRYHWDTWGSSNKNVLVTPSNISLIGLNNSRALVMRQTPGAHAERSLLLFDFNAASVRSECMEGAGEVGPGTRQRELQHRTVDLAIDLTNRWDRHGLLEDGITVFTNDAVRLCICISMSFP